MAHFAIKLKLILWKNVIIWKRHYILSIITVLMPLLIFSMLSFVYIASPKFNKVSITNGTNYGKEWIPGKLNCTLYYTPNNDPIEKFMNKIPNIPDKKGFATEKDMEDALDNYFKTHKDDSDLSMPVGVVIDLPNHMGSGLFDYQIRTDSQIQIESLYDYDSVPHNKEKYFDKFIPTQYALGMAFLEEHRADTANTGQEPMKIEVRLQESMPSPDIMLGQFYKYIRLLPLWTILAFVFVFSSVLKRIIEEKSTGVKEFTKMMGVDAWMLWLSWFIYSMVINIIAITIIVIILRAKLPRSICENSDPTTIWIFLFFYCSATVCFCFFISTLFKKPTMGMCVGVIIWLTTYFLFSYWVMNDDLNVYTFYRYFVMIWPNVCLVYGFKAISLFELKGTGLTWYYFFENPNYHTPHVSMACVCFMLIIDCIIFLILTLYIENVFPGEYGIARRWYYPFTKPYWCTKIVSTRNGHLAQIEERDDGVESGPTDTSAAIQIRNLSKLFRKKAAVDNFSFDIYENEITVLSGQNGAGKTITMNIITGMISSNSGIVLVNGCNIKSNINKARKSMGYCPQHNLLFSDLTVLEHLMFFAMLKGASKIAAKLESEQFLARLNMSSIANKIASELSGCMRRKLSLGIALAGHTRIVILDEPTSGMDPEARREIWDFLLSMRGERTILIATQNMEEADIVGDRIAMMHHGQLRCHGTSLFLKNHYRSTGYTLSLLVTESWNINTITEVIQNKIATATVKSNSSGFVTFELPTNDTEALSALLSNLETNKSQLSISSFCIALTTTDDVFLRVSEIAEETEKQHFTPVSSIKDFLTGRFLLWNQFLGLFIKRCQYARHRWIMILLQVLIPLTLITIIMIISENASEPVVRRNMFVHHYTPTEVRMDGHCQYRLSIFMDSYFELAEYMPGIVFRGSNASAHRYFQTDVVSAACRTPDLHRNWEFIATAIYGNLAVHGLPISLNSVINSFADMVGSYRVAGENNPWPQFQPKAVIKFNMSVITTWIFLFPIALTVMVGLFLPFIHEERRTGFKHLQLMAGVPRFLYWAVIFLFDILFYFTVCVLIIVIVISFDFGGPFGNVSSLLALSSLMFPYGFAILPFSYIFTYMSTAANCVFYFIWFHLIFGSLTTAFVYSFEFLGNIYKVIGDGLTYIFYISPNFALSNGIHKFINKTKHMHEWDNLSEMQQKVYYCINSTMPCCKNESTSCKEFHSYFAGDDSITPNIISLGILVLLYFFILFLLESAMLRKYYDKLRTKKVSVDSPVHQDDAEEKVQIENPINNIQGATHVQNDVLQVTNLRKYFGNFLAVDGLNFNVKARECVGLLGNNGAGKTTAFKMLTGEILPSTGTAKLMGYRLHGNRSNYLKNIGYCPQVDAFNLTLTCREMLQLFAYLRGIPCRLIKVHVNTWMNKFGIKQYENIRCGHLTGVDKRKLSTAVALIGNPPLIMLDEPISGADPNSWRNLKILLIELRNSGQSIILTSQSKVECEALCDRFATMVSGQMKSFGDIQYLKRIYGRGFTVKMKLKPAVALTGDVTDSVNAIDSIKRKMESTYCCSIIGEHTGMLLYHVKRTSATLQELFLFMEGLKSNVEILQGYTICDLSLEEVFLSLPKDDGGKCKATAIRKCRATHSKCASAKDC